MQEMLESYRQQYNISEAVNLLEHEFWRRPDNLFDKFQGRYGIVSNRLIIALWVLFKRLILTLALN